jgi:hypothetical protein
MRGVGSSIAMTLHTSQTVPSGQVRSKTARKLLSLDMPCRIEIDETLIPPR